MTAKEFKNGTPFTVNEKPHCRFWYNKTTNILLEFCEFTRTTVDKIVVYSMDNKSATLVIKGMTKDHYEYLFFNRLNPKNNE